MRNDHVQSRRVQREKLVSEIEEIREKFHNSDKPELNKYIRQCPENFKIKPTGFLTHWLTGFKIMRKNAEKIKETDIRKFFVAP